MRTVWATRAPSATLCQNTRSVHIWHPRQAFFMCFKYCTRESYERYHCFVYYLWIGIHICLCFIFCVWFVFIWATSHQPVKEWTMADPEGTGRCCHSPPNPTILYRLLSESSGLWVPPYFLLKRQCTQKWKFCHLLLTLMSFQTRKPFVYLRNTNEDIFDEIWAFWACIDSNATDTFKAQKCSKNIVKIVHVKKKIFKNSSDFIKNILIWDRNLKKGLTGLEGE